MNAIHDFGGVQGFGAVTPEPAEPVFHEDWERRVFGIFVALAAIGCFNADEFRHAQERIDPRVYLAAPYYKRWYLAVQTLLSEKRLLTDGVSRTALAPQDVGAFLATGGRYRSTKPVAPRFQRGDPVVARNRHPAGHTRAPFYVRGRPGTIDRNEGTFTFADSNAHGHGRQAQSLYRVRFTARDLWGLEGPVQDEVYLSLWEDHLEAATADNA